MKMTIVDVANGGAPLAGAAVYIWHCTREGGYSMYSDGVADQNFLRGVQETGSDGTVTFQSIYPGAYSGRWPHIHFEVYPSLDEATAAGDPSATSQIALPEDISAEVYATDGYEQSVSQPEPDLAHVRHGLQRRRRGRPAGHHVRLRSTAASPPSSPSASR